MHGFLRRTGFPLSGVSMKSIVQEGGRAAAAISAPKHRIRGVDLAGRVTAPRRNDHPGDCGRFALSETAEAVRRLGRGNMRGKAVINIQPVERS